jgi:polyisoprenoid-binding protein YceI
MSAVETTTLIPTGTWRIDPVHTTIGFQVVETNDLFSTINGRFLDYEGRLVGGVEPKLTGTIRVASLSTDNEQRDAHLTSPDFLGAEAYPQIRFESTAVEPLTEDRFLVRGDLTVKETPFPIEFEAHIRGLGQGKLGDERLVFDAKGSFEWGTTTVEVTAAVSAAKEA